MTTGLSRQEARFACRTKFRISNFEFPCMANRLINFGSRSRSNFNCASSVGLSQNARLSRTKSPVVRNWLEQSWKCSDKSALAWPGDSETAWHKLSSRKKKLWIYGAQKFKVEKSTYAGHHRLQEVQEVSKTYLWVIFGQQAPDHRASKSGQW